MKLRKVLALLLCIAMFIGSAPVITAKVVRVFTESVSEKVYFSPVARVIAGDINDDGTRTLHASSSTFPTGTLKYTRSP